MAQVVHLAFAPKVMLDSTGSSIVRAGGRLWDLTTWMPGSADFSANPSDERLVNACAALAELHRSWQPGSPRLTPVPAVLRRLRAFADWKQGRGAIISAAANRALLIRAAHAVDRWLEPAESALIPWTTRPVPVQPCLCDIHHDHVLFVGNRVSGIIDYGAMKEDHVAVDLARMLGDFALDDDAQLARGVEAYRRAGGALTLPTEFVRLLDHTGTLGGAIGWMLRFLENPRLFNDCPSARDRLAERVERIESFRGI